MIYDEPIKDPATGKPLDEEGLKTLIEFSNIVLGKESPEDDTSEDTPQ